MPKFQKLAVWFTISIFLPKGQFCATRFLDFFTELMCIAECVSNKIQKVIYLYFPLCNTWVWLNPLINISFICKKNPTLFPNSKKRTQFDLKKMSLIFSFILNCFVSLNVHLRYLHRKEMYKRCSKMIKLMYKFQKSAVWHSVSMFYTNSLFRTTGFYWVF